MTFYYFITLMANNIVYFLETIHENCLASLSLSFLNCKVKSI